MKKCFLLIVITLFIYGCGTAARQSEFPQHGSMYKSWDHMKFSWWGYKNPSAEDVKKASEEGWWGIEVPAPAAK